EGGILMMSVKRVAVSIGLALLLVGLVHDARAESPADREGVARAVTALVSAYESRQPGNVLKLISSRFSHPLGLEQALRDEYDAFHSTEVLFRVGSVVTGEDSASARVKWYRKRIDRKTGRQDNKEGEVTLFFSLEGGVYKLLRVEGESFLPASREGLDQKFRRVR
ncbi:MAG: hypothetical protein AABY65_10620, partial [Nitrospirota bacterium]